jgi:alpha-tubulin suppressor-like RCC1 family protein
VLTTLLAAGFLAAGSPVVTAAPELAAAETASNFTSLPPVRVLDTRDGTGGTTGPVGPGGTITLDLSAQVPATATAIVLNVTGVNPTAPTFVTVFPAGVTRPTASNLNLVPGDTRPNQVTVSLSADRRVSLYNNAGNTHLVADLGGYYGTGAGAKFTALPPNRVLDTRELLAPIGAGASRVVNLSTSIPASATAVTFNLTATEATAATFLTAWPTGAARPTASNVNIGPADTRPNLVTVAVGANRQVSLFNNAGNTHVIVDVTGFYTPDYGSSFVPLAPSRVLDTRDGIGGPVEAGGTVDLDLTTALPLTATGAMLNITGVEATSPTFVTAWPLFENRTTGSILNLNSGQTVPNAAAAAFGRLRAVQLFNNAGTVHLIADLAGYFAVLDPACTTDCVHAWGENFNRKLGTAQAVFDSGTPTRVVALSDVVAVEGGGSHNGYALRADGTVRAWGNNGFGQLGNDWTSNVTGGSPVPVPVVNLTDVTAIASGTSTAYALRENGTVWAWGSGRVGQLGNGTFCCDSDVPVQVSGLTDAIAVASAGDTGYALRANGTVVAWGANLNGELGNNSTVSFVSSPVAVSGLTGVTAITGGATNGYARRNNGTVWAWGRNSEGQLGNNTTVAFSRVPVQVSGLTTAAAIAAGRFNGYAVLADGTVRAWGAGSSGALGSGVDCSTIEFPCASRVPVQVSNLDDVTSVASFEYGGYALHADGTVSAWGFNGYQSLGNDSVAVESLVPVPVVGLAGVDAIGAGEYSGFAVRSN